MQQPQVKNKFIQLTFHFFRAEKIISMDSSLVGKGKSDVYIQLDNKGIKKKSSVQVCKHGDFCIWDEEFLVPLQVPIMKELLVFQVFDRDVLADDIIGSMEFKIKDFVDGKKNKEIFWINLHGAPEDVSGKYTDMMNENPKCASFWRGRILCRVKSSVEEVEHPVYIVQPCAERVAEKAVRYLENRRKFQYQLYVGAGLCLPKGGKADYRVEVRVAEHVITSDKFQTSCGNYYRWNQMVPDYAKRGDFEKFKVDHKKDIIEHPEHDKFHGTFDVTYQHINQVESVFFYLLRNHKRIAFSRIPISQFTDPGCHHHGARLQWLQLKGDLSIGQVKQDHKAGVISVMFSLVDITNLKTIGFASDQRITYNLKKRLTFESDSEVEKEPEKESILSKFNPFSKKKKDKLKTASKVDQVTSSDSEDDFMLGKGRERNEGGVDDGVGDHENPWADMFEWYDKGRGRKRMRSEKIRIHIFQCRDVPSADDDGNSDPFVVVQDDGSLQLIPQPGNNGRPNNQTDVIQKNLNPPFYQSLEISHESIKTKKAHYVPPFIFDVYDSDLDKGKQGKASKSDFLGRAFVPVDEIEFSTDDQILQPKWYPLRDSPGAPKEGEILASFCIAEENDYKFKRPANDTKLLEMVEFQDQEVSINVLGLRSLVSTGLVPVKKAFIQFNIASLIPPQWGGAVENIKTLPGAPGPNPTLNTLIDFKVPLPLKRLFSPVLSCQVFDQLFHGFSQPQIGTFMIPVGSLMHNLLAKRVADQDALAEICNRLQNILDEQEPSNFTKSTNLSVGNQEFIEKMKRMTQANKEQLEVNWNSAELDYEPSECSSMMDSVADADENVKLEALRLEQAQAVYKTGQGSWQEKAEQIAKDARKQDPQISVKSSSSKGSDNFRKRMSQMIQPESTKNSAGVKKMVAEQVTEAMEREKRLEQDARARDAFEFEQSNKESYSNVLFPEYAWDDNYKINREDKSKKPPNTLYLALGHDRDEFLLENPNPEENTNKIAEAMATGLLEKLNQAKLEASEKAASQRSGSINEDRDKEGGSVASPTGSILSGRSGKSNLLDTKKAEARKSTVSNLTRLEKLKEKTKEKEEKEDELLQIEVKQDQVVEADGDNMLGTGIITKKHYRRFYNDELEEVRELFEHSSPFSTFNIIKGSKRGNDKKLFSFLKSDKSKEGGHINSEKSVGSVKALIEIEGVTTKIQFQEEKDKLIECTLELLGKLALKRGIDFTLQSDEYIEKLMYTEGRLEIEQKLMEPLGISHLKITKKLSDFESMTILKRKLLVPETCIVRVYMVSGHNLAQRDIGSPSDPFIKVFIGKDVKNDRDNWQLDQENPLWHKSFDFQGEFPGCPPLMVEVNDYDDLFGDDEIGTTAVDLEDRFFMSDWDSMKEKPVETRQLYHPSFKVSQGLVRMWVEIEPSIKQQTGQNPCWDISPRKPDEFEVRIVVYDAEETKMMDVEDTSDAYVRCFFDSRDAEETDTHYRLQPNDTASWNYRLVFRVQHHFEKTQMHLFTIQMFDRDLFGSNDFIGSTSIDLNCLFEDSAITKKQIQMTKQYWEENMNDPDKPSSALLQNVQLKFDKDDEDGSFRVKLFGKNEETGEDECNSILRMLIDIVPVAIAEESPVGGAQDDPNNSPYLPPPIGRISFTLNPWKLFNMLLGPKARRAIKKWFCYVLCSALCVAICYYVVPGALANLLTSWI